MFPNILIRTLDFIDRHYFSFYYGFINILIYFVKNRLHINQILALLIFHIIRKMKITLIFTGKTSFGYLKSGIEDYLKRIKRYVSFEVKVIPDLKKTGRQPPAVIAVKEGTLILDLVSPGDYLVLLDENGKSFSSEKFAEQVQKWMNAGTRNLIFLIGGAYGFSPEVYKRADQKISLSDMTFSHQLVRLIFAEQFYRALTILRGEPYHHS